MKMLRVAAWLCGIALSLSGVSRGADDEQWQSLFNGKNLDGWVVEGTSIRKVDGQTLPIWSVVDGELRCDGAGFGFLRWDQQVCDFVLQAEFRPAKGANSGIGIRTVPYRNVRQTRPSFAAYEIQLQDDAGHEADTHCSGSLYRYVAPTANAMKPAGEWNTVEITCRGSQIGVRINDQQVQDVDQAKVEQIKDKPLCGYVSLQNHGGQVTFRNVRLRTLKTAD